jgi:hypothetical protein
MKEGKKNLVKNKKLEQKWEYSKERFTYLFGYLQDFIELYMALIL